MCQKLGPGGAVPLIQSNQQGGEGGSVSRRHPHVGSQDVVDGGGGGGEVEAAVPRRGRERKQSFLLSVAPRRMSWMETPTM